MMLWDDLILGTNVYVNIYCRCVSCAIDNSRQSLKACFDSPSFETLSNIVSASLIRDGVQRALRSQVNYRICFEGAKRGSQEASVGMTVIAYYDSGERDLLLRAGKLLGKLDSSFLAEALALEWSPTKFFDTILDKKYN